MNIFIYLIEKNLGVLAEFFDYKNDNFEKDFQFVREVGVTFQMLFNRIIRKKLKKSGLKMIKNCSILKEEGILNLTYYMIEVQSLDYKLEAM